MRVVQFLVNQRAYINQLRLRMPIYKDGTSVVERDQLDEMAELNGKALKTIKLGEKQDDK